MVGLDEVKQKLDGVLREGAITAKYGDVFPGRSRHLLFMGNPGTGKTVVAQDLATVMADMGIVGTSTVAAANASDFIKPHVGESEAAMTKTLNQLASIGGGVLFIDEAPQLMNSDYGKNVLQVLVPWMENNRNNSMVILAGYTKPMKELLKVDPGLASRFPESGRIEFADYDQEQRLEIADREAQSYGWTFDIPEAQKKAIIGPTDPDHNARGVREDMGNAISNAVMRLVDEGKDPSDPKNKKLTVADFS